MKLLSVFFTLVWLSVLSAAAQKFEAEAGVLQGTTIEKSRTGFSGNGYVTGFVKRNKDAVTVNVKVANAGFYTLSMSYASPFEAKFNFVFVNNDSLGTIKFPYTETFRQMDIEKIWLNKGDNQIGVQADWGYVEIDYFNVTPAALPIPSQAKSMTLVTTDPLPEATQLLSYLNSIYGKKTLAGQQEGGNDFEYIEKNTGKIPAIKGFDLLNYTTAVNWEDETPQRVIEWYTAKNGIPTVCWHWFSPSGAKGPKSFYSSHTDFDVSLAVQEGTDENTQILRDIDAIAAQLKIIEEANVPILWRPLHEASFQAFWWGSRGPDVYKKLYNIVFERLNNHHKLKNLIWVWTSGVRPATLEWYPGNAVVDIVGADIYIDNQNSIVRNFDFLTRSYEGKIIAMSENGLLPKMDRMKEGGATWSWFCTWQGKLLTSGNSLEDIKTIFNHEDVITLDELPRWTTRPVVVQEKQAPEVSYSAVRIGGFVFLGCCVIFVAIAHVRLRRRSA